LTACGTLPATPDAAEPPTAFHNTRLSYALLTDDDETLRRDFQMKTRPTWVTRVVASVLLLPAGGMEAMTWPVFVGLRGYLDANREPSVPVYLPGIPGLPPPSP
jgi:hypothetical protein